MEPQIGSGKKPDSKPDTTPTGVPGQVQLQGTSQSGFLATVSAVLWSFFGVRRSDHHEADMQNLKPIHVIVVGILAALAFVLTLVAVVKAVVP